MADPFDELPLHSGYEPSQPDPPQWAALTRVPPPPAPGLRRGPPETAGAPTSELAAALACPVTLANLADVLKHAPSVQEIFAYLQLPDVVYNTIVDDLSLADLDTLLASLSD